MNYCLSGNSPSSSGSEKCGVGPEKCGVASLRILDLVSLVAQIGTPGLSRNENKTRSVITDEKAAETIIMLNI